MFLYVELKWTTPLSFDVLDKRNHSAEYFKLPLNTFYVCYIHVKCACAESLLSVLGRERFDHPRKLFTKRNIHSTSFFQNICSSYLIKFLL